MAVHIGKVIRALVTHKGIKISEFAKKVNCSRRTIYDVFERDSIDTKLLESIGKFLGENLFFQFITNEDIEVHVKRETQIKEISRLLDVVLDKLENEGKKRKKLYLTQDQIAQLKLEGKIPVEPPSKKSSAPAKKPAKKKLKSA